MKRDRINVIIRKAYAERYGLVPEVVSPRQPYILSRIQPVLARIHPMEFVSQRRVMISLSLFVVLIVGITAYYYNGLVRAQQDMLTAVANVNALLQRRHDTVLNMSKTVLDYAKHERTVMNEVTKLRALHHDSDTKSQTDSKVAHANKFNLRSPEIEQLMKQKTTSEVDKGSLENSAQPDPSAPAKKDSLFSTLTTLLALAEQYPDLKLSGNFQNLMNAMNEWEKALAEQRIRCNEMINVYTTKRAVFPSNLFAVLFRFPNQEQFKADEGAQGFVPIEY